MTLNRVKAEEVPEVMELLKFEKRYRKRLTAITPVLENLDILKEAADKAVRARGVSCDRFVLLSQSPHINWKALYDALGQKRFMDLVGGTVETTTKYGGDKTKYKLAQAKGAIDPELNEQVYKEVNRYRKV